MKFGSSGILRMDLQSSYLSEVSSRILYGYFIFLAISFIVIDARYSEFLAIGLLYLCSVLSGFSFFVILAHSQSDIKYAVKQEFYCKAVLSGLYYLASFEDLYSKKCRRCLYSDYCSVDLRALPAVIHILSGIISVPVLFVFVLPLIEIARTQFL